MALRSVALAVVVACSAVSATACSNDVSKPIVAEASTTTDPALAADLEPDPAAPPAREVVAALEAAVTSSNFCDLLDAMGSAEPAASDRSGAIDVYRALSAAVARSQSFVPPELREAWQAVVAATDAASTAVKEHGGDVRDPDVEAALTSTAMSEAMDSVERYQLTTCPPPSAG